jgi:hypothetical protein
MLQVMEERANWRRVVGIVLVAVCLLGATAFLIVKNSASFGIEVIGQGQGQGQNEYDARTLTLRLTNRSTRARELWKTNGELNSISYYPSGTVPPHGGLRPGPRAYSLPMFVDTVSLPPDATVEITTVIPDISPGASIRAWWQPPVAGGVGMKPSLIVAIRSKLSEVIYDPLVRIALPSSTPPGWRERLADWIGPRSKPVSSEAFVLEP